MKIHYEPLSDADLKQKIQDPKQLGFGKRFTDRMFLMNYTEGKGWHDPRIVKYGPLSLDPACTVLHYGQEIFEGLKAYPRDDGSAYLFRPELNIERFNVSAERLCMPQIPEADFLQALEALVDIERDWIPNAEGTSLYIRPTMIGVEPALGVRAATQYLFFIILSPVGAYFSGGFKPVTIEANDQYVRAVRGGVGYAKTSANYAPTLRPASEALARGCDQVLWLDAIELKYVEEMGGMNIFFVIDGKLVTSPLGGTILPGVTRYCVIELARDMGLEVEERRLSIDEVVERSKDGTLTESFASGTAAVITSVGNIVYKGEKCQIGTGEPGATTLKFYETLTKIQYGQLPDEKGWTRQIPQQVAAPA